MSFPRYPQYKDSGVAWLGEVPAHWEVGQVRRYFSVELGKMLDASKQDGSGIRKPYLRAANVFWDSIDVTDVNEMEFSPSQLSRYLLQCGDLLVTEGGATVGRSAIWQDELDECFYQNSLNRVRPLPSAGLPSRYLLYWIQFATQTGFVELVSDKATFGHLTNEKLKALPLFGPATTQEATAIATFLDRETAKIDALVAEQQRLIELLREKRQAVIAHAVTKGLNPDAPMKPSGVEWLGEVPAHWEVVQSRRLFGARNEMAHETDVQLTASQKYGILPQGDFVEAEGRRVVEMIKGVDTLRHVEPNDFVISLRSFQGGIEWSKIRGSVTWHYVVLTPIKHVYPPFFAHLFKSINYIQALRSTTNLIRDGQDLRYSHFVQVDLPIIPIEEQTAIAALLDRETAAIDELITETEHAIGLLQERRQTLISAAVTGQIDVRQIVDKGSA